MPSDSAFGTIVKNGERLRELIALPAQMVIDKVIGRMDRHVMTFVDRCPYAIISTSDGRGRCDASPRGGAPGFIRVIDESHLLMAELPGNRRADSICNLLENPFIGLLLLIPGYRETLRINGTAVITEDSAILAGSAVNGRVAAVGIGITIVECYLHCAKASIRSNLWNPASWPPLEAVPSAAEMLRDHTKAAYGDGSVAHIEDMLVDSYKNRL